MKGRGIVRRSPEVNYDSDYDILYLYVGEPVSSYAEEPAPGVYVRYSNGDDRVSGAVIHDYRKRDRDLLDKMLPFKVDFAAVERSILTRQ